MYDYPMMNGNEMGYGVVTMLFLIVVLIVLAVMAMHFLKGHDHSHGDNHKTDPINIAKERYAKGEITKEQFVQLKKDLS